MHLTESKTPWSFFACRTPHALLIWALGASLTSALSADWSVTKGKNEDLPGQNVTVANGGKIVARLIYGEGQQMPYLALYDEKGRRVTNAGIDRDGKEVGSEPHHRGIFLGWQKIQSSLGVANLWSMREGTRMQLVSIEKMDATETAAAIVARIEWRAGNKDASGSDLLITETRRMVISQPDSLRRTQVDLAIRLEAARELTLDGNVQHAGVHFRAAHPVAKEPAKTSYLWSPDVPGANGTVVSDRLQWGEFVFPLEERWYRAAQFNAPANPVQEFSKREYGRFGYFFKKTIARGEALSLVYRFLLESIPAPAQNPKRSAAELAAARRDLDTVYAQFVASTAR